MNLGLQFKKTNSMYFLCYIHEKVVTSYSTCMKWTFREEQWTKANKNKLKIIFDYFKTWEVKI